MSSSDDEQPVTDATVVAAESERVGLVSCKTCGAALLLDAREDFDVVQRHVEWHERFGF